MSLTYYVLFLQDRELRPEEIEGKICCSFFVLFLLAQWKPIGWPFHVGPHGLK